MPLESLDRVREKFDSPFGKATVYNILKLKDLGYDVERLPYSIRILLENAARHSGKVGGALEAVHALAQWPNSIGRETPFMPHRVLLQDYTGVPLVVDLAGMRDAAKAAGIDPGAINSQVPVDLVIDHSIQVDAWGSGSAFSSNLEKEYERNAERYSLLKWARTAFKGMRVFPPGKGICHQFNLEYLAQVVAMSGTGDGLVAYPDTLVGADSHTTMVNGLGCLGWGVGGIEAEAVMLGEPYHMPIPSVFGVKFTGALREGVTPTDLVLAVTERLREKNVVGAFVEYFGEGYSQLSVPDRATIGNMSPEYGATAGFFPVDGATLTYLTGTGRPAKQVELVSSYAKRCGFFVTDVEPRYTEVIRIELDKIEPSIAGPRNPEERHALVSVPSMARTFVAAGGHSSGPAQAVVQADSAHSGLSDGSVVIAAITSCTNTSNPTVMVGAGLIAKRAVEAGLTVKPWVKPSLAPGSTVVTDYLTSAGLVPSLEKLGFFLVGYGCTSCIGNSGPLAPEVEKEIKERDLYAVAALSGNRNFEGRIHPLAKGSFLMSPMLVVAYALAGRIDFDFSSTPLGVGKDGRPVYLKDLWPSMKDVKDAVEKCLDSSLYERRYADAMKGDERWEKLGSSSGDVYDWDPSSTYIRRPPWFDPDQSVSAKRDVKGARVLAVFRDKVTTDHISPAGMIAIDSPAGSYLGERGVGLLQMSTYGSRRGNHEVLVRGGFSNIRLRNVLAKGKEGGYTQHFPDAEVMSIFDAAERYARESVPLVILAGKQYGAGSSRDWAAKAPKLLGVRAVIAESFERIHRSNLVAMGVIPLQFKDGEGVERLGLTGEEVIDIVGIERMDGPKDSVEVVAKGSSGEKRFSVLARVDNAIEMEYLRSGGVLPYVFGRLPKSVH
ncbi:MAG: aconitate hydratase AcnA [Nitrososphaerota archaeon]|jgi:aconitate hydratase|nr:aconitate hydratase AcnA [Nitrososphaerota archaeon]MDG6961337.1 aconitate hydratase AcnA [Nitrososphaerota archaeon]MDG6962845.1 aconitate hydratase AcnA [Nitrososphaerota archaeon]MDG6971172.1 aconitate hydratase AcnA [Nitrososphaerota archaeon]MDG6984892.1 aconitate hydratase AcnA [Nitrososphaerota archaeon]